MRIFNHLIRTITALAIAFAVSGVAGADSIRDFGRHVVHCRFVNTIELDEESATQLSIARTDGRGALIIAVMEKPDDGSMEHPVSGSVTAHWSDVNGMMGTIQVREIRDRAAIYYIGEFDIPRTSTMTFDILVGVEENKPPYKLSFSKHFSKG